MAITERNGSSAHAAPVEAVVAELAVDPAQGLTSGEAATRLERHGPNKLTEKKKHD